MSNAVAVRNEQLTDVESRILATRTWLTDYASPAEMVAALREIKMMGEWLRVTKAATEMRMQALTLEYIALRKVGGTDFVPDLPANMRSVAKWLSAMPEANFEGLMSEIGVNYSPLAAYRAHLKRQYRDSEQERLMNVARGGDLEHLYQWTDGANPDRLNVATRVLLDEMIEMGVPFKTSEVAMQLADRLEIDSKSLTREQIAKALTSVITTAVNRVGDVREVLIHGALVKVPQVVTIHDNEFGWMRVPFWNASLGQLLAMAGDHEARAQAALAKAAELRRLASFFEAQGSPEDNLAELELRAKRRRHMKSADAVPEVSA